MEQIKIIESFVFPLKFQKAKLRRFNVTGTFFLNKD